MTSTYELRNQALDLGEAVRQAKDEYNKILDDPRSTTEAVEAAKAKLDNRIMKYNGKQELIKEQEAQDKINLKATKAARKLPEDPKARLVKAEAAWIRKTMRPDNADYQEKWNNVKQELKDDTETNGGDLQIGRAHV